MGRVKFPLDQINSLTGKGVVDTYQEYLTIENAVKAVLLSDNEVDVAHNVKANLSNGDIFFDVGAHFGYFAAMGMECVGTAGQVHVFEPAPLCFAYLDRLKTANPGYNCVVNKVGVGDKKGEMQLYLAPPPHLSSHTMVPGFLGDKCLGDSQAVCVPIVRLDDYIAEHAIVPRLIKIDVEGYEFMVLRGLEGFLEKTSYRPVVICEMNYDAYRLLGHAPDDIYRFMGRYGYTPYYSWNPKVRISDTTRLIGHNAVFLA
jgi:FkbM family methyltransferase